jgi:hypothetical protein
MGRPSISRHLTGASTVSCGERFGAPARGNYSAVPGAPIRCYDFVPTDALTRILLSAAASWVSSSGLLNTHADR